MSASPEARDLFAQMQMVTAGHKAGDVIQALLDTLTCAIAFTATDMANADAMIDTLPEDLRQALRSNWDVVREMRGRAPAGGGRA